MVCGTCRCHRHGRHKAAVGPPKSDVRRGAGLGQEKPQVWKTPSSALRTRDHARWAGPIVAKQGTDLACCRAVSRLRRPILHSRFFFVTTNLRKGLRPFNDREFDMLAHSLLRVRELVPVALCAYCFMPDHVHAILFPQEQTTISDVMMRFKIASSRRMRPLRGRAFWQARFLRPSAS